MRIRAPTLLLTALLAVSCQRATERASPLPRRAQAEENSDDHVTVEAVDGKPLPPEFRRALAAAGKQWLTDAFSKALADGMEEMCRKLRISDDLERRLLMRPYDWGSPDRPGDTWCIHLLRPGDAAAPRIPSNWPRTASRSSASPGSSPGWKRPWPS